MGLAERNDASIANKTVKGLDAHKPFNGLEVEQMSQDQIVPAWLNELGEMSVEEQLKYLRVGEVLFVRLRGEGIAIYREKTNDWLIKVSTSQTEAEVMLTFGHELGHILFARDKECVLLPPEPDPSLFGVWNQARFWEQVGVRKLAVENICEEFGKAWSAVERNAMECSRLLRDSSREGAIVRTQELRG